MELLDEINKVRNHGGVDAYAQDVLKRCYHEIEWLTAITGPDCDVIEQYKVENNRLRAALYEIIELDHHNQAPESRATGLARAALSNEQSVQEKT